MIHALVVMARNTNVVMVDKTCCPRPRSRPPSVSYRKASSRRLSDINHSRDASGGMRLIQWLFIPPFREDLGG
jgi:hypothetical protein